MVNKKTYIKPSTKAVQSDDADLICSSITSFSLNEDEVDNYDEYEHQVDTHGIWGSQW